jgi:hypothetical protein
LYHCFTVLTFSSKDQLKRHNVRPERHGFSRISSRSSFRFHRSSISVRTCLKRSGAEKKKRKIGTPIL